MNATARYVSPADRCLHYHPLRASRVSVSDNDREQSGLPAMSTSTSAVAALGSGHDLAPLYIEGIAASVARRVGQELLLDILLFGQGRHRGGFPKLGTVVRTLRRPLEDEPTPAPGGNFIAGAGDEIRTRDSLLGRKRIARPKLFQALEADFSPS